MKVFLIVAFFNFIYASVDHRLEWFESRTYSQILEEIKDIPELEQSLVEVTRHSNAIELMSLYPGNNRFNLNDFQLGSSLQKLTIDGPLNLASFNPTFPIYECSPDRHSMTLGNDQSPVVLNIKNHLLPDEISGRDKFDKALLAHCSSKHGAASHWYFGSGFLQLSKYEYSHNIEDLPWWIQEKERSYLDKLHRYVKQENNFSGQKTFLGSDQYEFDGTLYVSPLEKALFDGEYEIALDIIKVTQPRFGKIDFSKKNRAEVPLIDSMMLSDDPKVDSILDHLLDINSDPYYNCLKKPNGHMYLGLEDVDYFKLDDNGRSIFDKLRNNKTRFDLMEKILRNIYPYESYGEGEYPEPKDWEREKFLTKHLDKLNNLVLVEGVLRGPGIAELSFDETKEIASKIKLDDFVISKHQFVDPQNNYTATRELLEEMEYENNKVKSLFLSMLTKKEFEREVEIIAEQEARKYVDALHAEMERIRKEEVERREREVKRISGNIFKCGNICKNFSCNIVKPEYWISSSKRSKCRSQCAECSSSADELNNILKAASFVVAPTLAIQAGALIVGAKEVKEHCSKEENRKDLACRMSCSMTVDSSGEARDQRCEVTTESGEKLSLNPYELGDYYKNQFIKDTEHLNLTEVNREFEQLFDTGGDSEQEILDKHNEWLAQINADVKKAYTDLELFRMGKTEGMPQWQIEMLEKIAKEQGIESADWIFDMVMIPYATVKVAWGVGKAAVELSPKIMKGILGATDNLAVSSKEGLVNVVNFFKSQLKSSIGAAGNLNDLVALERKAKSLNINFNSPTSKSIVSNLEMNVVDFIGQFRKASVKSEFPREFFEMTVEEALKSKNSTVRKLLLDNRFLK